MFFFFLSLSLALMPSLQLFVCLLRLNVDKHMHACMHTQMHTYTELHMIMNIDFLRENLDVYTQL